MNVEIAWLRSATDDLDATLDFVERESPRGAISILTAVRSGVEMLGRHPDAGRPGRVRGTREMVLSGTPFVVVYRIRARPRRIEVLRVLHGRRMWPPGPPPASA